MPHLRLFWSLLLTSLLLFFFSPVWAVENNSPPSKPWTAQEAVAYALTHSPEAKGAQKRILAAEADLQAARSAFYPALAVSAGYSRTNNPMYSFGNILNQGSFNDSIDFNDPGTTDTLQAKATLQYRVYNGGQDKANLEAADQTGQAARMQKQAVRNQLAQEVVRAFYTVIQAEDTVQARTSSVKAIDANLHVAKARFQEGTLLKEELLNMEVQQAKSQEQLIQAQHGLSLAQRGFLRLLGIQGATVQLNQVATARQNPPQEQDIHQRPELLAMAAFIKAQEARVRQANAGNYPTADAFGTYQVDKGTELDQGSGNSWTAGMQLNYSLYDGERTAAAISKARAKLGELRENQRSMELTFNLELEQAKIALHQEEERLKVSAKRMASARESARLARLRFKEGVLLASEMVDTENRLTEAEVNHALATTARKMAIADLRYAVGLSQFNH